MKERIREPFRPAPPAAAIPFRRTDEHALLRHEEILKRIAAGPIDLLFLGDSITRRWAEHPEAWESVIGATVGSGYSAANFGVGSDRCQDLLWRLENGEMEGYSPKLVVLLIGTNNAPEDRGRDIAAGVSRIVELLRTRFPEAGILLLAIFPRGPRRGEEGYGPEARRISRAIAQANAALRRLAESRSLHYIDLGDLFLGEGGRIRQDLLPDRLHPGEEGFKLLAEALRPIVAGLMA